MSNTKKQSLFHIKASKNIRMDLREQKWFRKYVPTIINLQKVQILRHDKKKIKFIENKQN